MIHFPQFWLEWMEDTSALLKSALGPPEDARFLAVLPEVEFRLHTSVFIVRKIEESTGVALHLSSKTVRLSSWPASGKKKSEICRSSNPDLAAWYRLKNSQDSVLTYKRVIDLFVHARICSFSFTTPFKSPMEDVGVFVSSDHTLKDRIFRVPFVVVDDILQHSIAVFRPIVERRERGMVGRVAQSTCC